MQDILDYIDQHRERYLRMIQRACQQPSISTQHIGITEMAELCKEMLAEVGAQVEIVPIEVVVRNVVAGSLAKRLDLTEGEPIEPALVEFYYKNDALGDPLITEEHVRLLKLAGPPVVRQIKELALKVNGLLLPFFRERRMKLVDFKLEFGLYHDALILADEISPDTCRFWDMGTGESMDKDRFRKDLGRIEEAYQEVLKRVCG